MPERKFYTLSQVGTAIKKRIEEATHGDAYWIKAEITSFRATKHAYLELAEHRHGEKVAVMHGAIWFSSLQRIRQELGPDSRNILKEGVEILFQARPHFHLVYGLSLVIEAIDLDFNISALERRKRETIATLKEEGLFHRNRLLVLPMVVQRIALVASSGTAAYADLMQHLENNEHGYCFHVRVFQATVQGDTASAELRAALASIDPAKFDAVVVVRGGGSKLDLEPFNDLALARAVAQLPIPVLTGIGHEVDISVLDLIANSPHKTPTAVADFLVDRTLYFETAMTGILVNIHNSVLTAFTGSKERISSYKEMISMRPGAYCRTQRGALHTRANQFMRGVAERLTLEHRLLDAPVKELGVLPKHRLAQVETTRIHDQAMRLTALAHHGMRQVMGKLEGIGNAVHLISPDRLLERGFSITRHQGKAVRTAQDLRAGDEIETTFAEGKAWATIRKTESHGE
jgi:exodeoxyribonuclease VII large subunit